MDTNKFMEGYIGAMKAAGVHDEDMQDMIVLGEAAAMAHEVPAMLPAIDSYIAKRAQAAATNAPAATATEPDWLDTPADKPLFGSGFDRSIAGENKRLNRALSYGGEGSVLPNHAYDRDTDVPMRVKQVQDAGRSVSSAPEGSTAAWLDERALRQYDRSRYRRTPRGAEDVLKTRGLGPQIPYIRDLIRRGVIQAGNRQPATAGKAAQAVTLPGALTQATPPGEQIMRDKLMRSLGGARPSISKGLKPKLPTLPPPPMSPPRQQLPGAPARPPSGIGQLFKQNPVLGRGSLNGLTTGQTAKRFAPLMTPQK